MRHAHSTRSGKIDKRLIGRQSGDEDFRGILYIYIYISMHGLYYMKSGTSTGGEHLNRRIEVEREGGGGSEAKKAGPSDLIS